MSTRKLPSSVSGASEMPSAQAVILGLIGMAAPANRAYLTAFHAHARPADRDAAAGLNRLKCMLYEIDFFEFARSVRGGLWERAELQLAEAASSLKAAGAGFLVITSNTGNTLTQLAQTRTRLPVMDIVDPTLSAVRMAGCKRAGVVGTSRTLDSGMFQDAAEHYGVEIVPPSADIHRRVESVIFSDLIHGQNSRRALDVLIAATAWFDRQGADSVILGCTDMTHLADQVIANTGLFVADTTRLHAAAAASVAWGKTPLWSPAHDKDTVAGRRDGWLRPPLNHR